MAMRMKEIPKSVRHMLKDKPIRTSLCGQWGGGDVLVVSALESDCEACRTKANVGMPAERLKPGEKDPYAVRPTPSYTPRPYPNADKIMAAKKAKVDGR